MILIREGSQCCYSFKFHLHGNVSSANTQCSSDVFSQKKRVRVFILCNDVDCFFSYSIWELQKLNRCPRDVSGGRSVWSDPLPETESTMWAESHLQQQNPLLISSPCLLPSARISSRVLSLLTSHKLECFLSWGKKNVSTALQGHVPCCTQLILFSFGRTKKLRKMSYAAFEYCLKIHFSWVDGSMLNVCIFQKKPQFYYCQDFPLSPFPGRKRVILFRDYFSWFYQFF